MATEVRAPELRVPRRGWLILAGVVVAVPVLAGVAWSYAASPPALPLSDARVSASTPVAAPVYLGVFTAGSDFGRTLHLAGVKVRATSSVPVEITPLLCVGGSVSVTTDPRTFCQQVTNPEHHSFGAGDSIVLEVTGREPGAVSIEPPRLAYRDGLRWDTQSAGSPSVVSLLARAD